MPQDKLTTATALHPLVHSALVLLIAIVVLFTLILPAEYGIDPTGIGHAVGLHKLSEHTANNTLSNTSTLTIVDAVGGNQNVLESRPTSKGEPVPLPNPAVFQKSLEAAKEDQRIITLQPGEQTETKLLMNAGRSAYFSWAVDQGSIYVDFHGHEHDDEIVFVRYEKLIKGMRGYGSLSAPFSGEHGWYWVNNSSVPVTITLRVSGFYERVLDFNITSSLPF